MSILSDGQVSNVQGTIFIVDRLDVRPKKTAKIEKITFFNTSATAQTAILFLRKKGEVARSIRQFVLQENEGGEYLEPGEFIVLTDADELQAVTTTDAVVNFAVIGERQ